MTHWLIVQSANTGKIIPEKTKRFDGTRPKAEDAAAELRIKLGSDYLVTRETDKEARLYNSYRQFPGNE